MGKQKIESVEQFNDVIKEEGKIILFKHSLTCPISQEAYEEFNSFVETNRDVKGYILHVQEARLLSNHIAEQFNIKHESPQAFVIEEGSVKWHASHWKITEKSLSAAMNN